MKITQEILDNGKWLSDGRFRYNGESYWKIVCGNCGEECFTRYSSGKYCSKSCLSTARNKNLPEETKAKQIAALLNYNNPYRFKKGHLPWNVGIPVPEEQKERTKKALTGRKQTEQERKNKCGPRPNIRCPYTSKGIPKYDMCAPNLEPYEECKRSKRDPNILRVKCAYCGIWYIPTLSQITNRLHGINHNDGSRFYCSNSCKQECPIYGQIKYFKGQKGHSSREVQPELRQLVFLRDGYECQKCGSVESLHCHHITGVEVNPIESADVDNCITLCKPCHKEAHTDKGCRYWDLRRCSEDNQTMVVI